MKKTLLVILLMLSGLSFAQFNIQLENTRFGVIAGPVYSRVQNAHNPSTARVAFYGGALALIPIDNDNQFYIQPQVEYLSAGEKGTGSTVYANNYISVPVYFKGFFSEAESEFFGFFGPRFGFLIGQKVENPSREVYKVDQIGKANSFDFALSGGLGFSYKRKIELNARFDYGISNTFPDMIEVKSGDPNTYSRKKQHILSVGLSYIFD